MIELTDEKIEKYLTPYRYPKPVLHGSGTEGAFDEKAVDIPFVFRHKGQFYMLYTGFDGKGYQSALAVSDDLLHWTHKGVILKRNTDSVRWDRIGGAATWMIKESDNLWDMPRLKKVDGKYWMVYHSYPGVGYESGPAEIGLAWCEDEELMEWHFPEEPSISWRDGAEWEAGGLYKACIIENQGTWYMFYNAKDRAERWTEQTGMAYSTDLQHWTRCESNPVLRVNRESWDKWFVSDPYIVKDGDTWVNFYFGYGKVYEDGHTHAQEGLALSKDLVSWEKVGEPIIPYGPQGSIDSGHVHKASIVYYNGILYHFYCATCPWQEGYPTNSYGEYRTICVATSKPVTEKADRIYYGGDYNPDQWDDETIDEDMRLFKKAGINLLTLPVFSWAKLEPDEGVYNFEWLDAIIDKIWRHGIRICLATPTTAQPAWLSARYPEVLPVDIAGRRRTHGMRVFFCVNSLKYRERAAAIAEEMAKRYAHHPALAMWHVSNEYGTYCYCPACQAKFRVWLRKRYGTVEELNRRWHTAFWGRIVGSFEEVMLPTELNDDYRFNPAVQLDYMRFVTDSTAECFRNEYRVLKRYNPAIPIQTNMSGYIKKLDQFTMTKEMDIVGWDNYPWPDDPPYFVAMKHDIMRGLKGGQSFILTEQSPNQQNWQPYNLLKRPGEVRRLSYQAMAHGADTCLFFQMRQSIAGQEKFHGAIIGHSGREDTRVFREAALLGRELQAIGDAFLEGRTPAKAAMLFDWNNWWALELSSGPSKDMDYLKTFSLYYETLYRQNIPVDILPYDARLEGYHLVVAPMLYMLKDGVAKRLEDFVNNGGTLVTTVMSGLADENDRCVFGAYPGPLKKLLGIWVEETDALRPYEKNRMRIGESLKFSAKEYDCGFLCDIIHPEGGAQVLAAYEEDFYAGVPCITRNAFGKGKTYYVGTQPEQVFLEELMEQIAAECGLSAPCGAGESVEVTLRKSPVAEVIFAINHGKEDSWVDFEGAESVNLMNGQRLTGKIKIAPGDVIVAGKR